VSYAFSLSQTGQRREEKSPEIIGNVRGDSDSVDAGEYSVREFQAQRTDFHGEARPERLLMDFPAQIPGLLNDEPFGSTHSLASQFAVTRQ
jgi:hypothetical protein